MKIECNLEKLRETKPGEYAMRFAFGGLVTAIASWVGIKYGPVVGGLFLGFPSILPATVTLLQKHEEKEQTPAQKREAKNQAGDDSLGAAIGSFGLLCFGLVVWFFGEKMPVLAVIAVATLTWAIAAFAAWLLVMVAKKSLEAKQPGRRVAKRKAA